MKLTNKYNLPDALLRAVENDPYTKGERADYSITGLLKPPRQAALESIYRDQIEDDVSDRLFSLYGQVAHLILERANLKDLSEKRFYAEFSGKIVSGQIDTLSLENDTLTDWKFTSSWGFKTNQPVKPEWEAQVNMQLELLRQNNLDAKNLQIVGLLRDWSKMEAKRSKDYPQKPVQTVSIPVWSRQKTQSFIRMRIQEHELSKESLPFCSSEERWARPDQFAVMVQGKKRALTLQFKKEVAEKMAEEAKGYVEIRPGESIRCESYCSVSKFCEQFKQLKKENADEV